MSSPSSAPHPGSQPGYQPSYRPAGRRPAALVTGASSGIGREFARQLAESGYDVVLVARNRARLDAVATELTSAYSVDTEVLVADLADREQLAVVEARVADAEHPVDLLVNNAGFGLARKFLVNDVEDEQGLLDVLVVATMRLSHAGLRAMAERGYGGVVNVSSVAAFFPRGTYSSAKTWVNSFSRWADTEYRPRGITVTAVCPGFVKTEFHERMDVRRGSGPLWLDVERVVREGLADHAAGQAISIPSLRYRTIVRVGRVVPSSLTQRLQGLGRKRR